MSSEQYDQQQETDPWAPVTISADAVAEHEQLQQAYQATLSAAGYGDEQRTQYIAESGEDPEAAACTWDDLIVPAAQAAGAIPPNPSPYSPAENATLTAVDRGAGEFLAQHSEYDVWSNSPEHQELWRQAVEYGNQKARDTLGDQVAEHLLTVPKAPDADLDDIGIDEHDLDM